MIPTQVAIINTSLAGLRCAIECEKENIDYVLLDSSTKIGGRQQNSFIDSYVCDHGFQMLLTAYDEVQS